MTIKDSLNKLVENITGDNVKTKSISDSLTEFVKALDAGGYLESTDDTISEILDVIAEVLPDKIGIKPTGTIEITENGEYDVTEYAEANVEVAGGDYYEENLEIFEGRLTKANVNLKENSIVVTIPHGVTTIGYNAFKNDKLTTKVIMPDTVTTIESYIAFQQGAPFAFCEQLRTIVFSKNITEIPQYICYGSGRLQSISIPQGVTTIGDAAFYGCDSLVNVDIPDTVISIGINTFNDCQSLNDVIIPKSVVSIGDNAFIGCTSLVNIYYTGTQAEWEAITNVLNAGIPEECTINYEYTP